MQLSSRMGKHGVWIREPAPTKDLWGRLRFEQRRVTEPTSFLYMRTVGRDGMTQVPAVTRGQSVPPKWPDAL